MQIFSKNLREVRKAMGFTQKQLAEKLNTTNSSVCDWECDRAEPNLETLVRLAEILESSIDDLLGK